MPPKPSLTETLASAEALISQFLDSLSPSADTSSTPSPNPPPPLPLLSDSARLLKAHVTKLSLLAINKPFTPSAITSVLREITSTCLPAMMSVVQICDSQTAIHGRFLATEVRARVRRVMREMQSLVREVQSINESEGAGKPSTKPSGAAKGSGRDSLSATGVVWDGCDELVSLSANGAAGLAVQRAEEYRDMLKDAIAELQEWREGGDDANEGRGDDLLDSDDEGVDGDRESLDDIFNAAHSLPEDRPELRQLVEEAEEKLKKVVILYTALIKRRLKTFSASPESKSAQRLDLLMESLKEIPETVDELANTFYDLDEDKAKATLTKVVGKAGEASKLADRNAMDKEDEFTIWAKKWREVVS